MWAKSESLQNAGHQMAGALTPPRRRKPEKNRVLRCQLVLCAAAVLGMLLLQRLRPESAERFKAESRTMLSSPLMGQQQVVRFAMAAAEKLQQAAQIQPQQAQRILEDIRQNGPYKTLAEVARVPGISEAMIQKWQGLAVTD